MVARHDMAEDLLDELNLQVHTGGHESESPPPQEKKRKIGFGLEFSLGWAA